VTGFLRALACLFAAAVAVWLLTAIGLLAAVFAVAFLADVVAGEPRRLDRVLAQVDLEEAMGRAGERQREETCDA